MAGLGLLIDERYKLHETGRGHPESAARLDSVREALERAGLLATLPRVEPYNADDAFLLRIHTREYLTRLEQACRDQQPFIDVPDSAICARSAEIARLAAGGVAEGARRVGRGELQRVFCAVRPPGHHAEADHSLGFCLFNHVALAATVFREEFGRERVAILDWDVHHGNGTQHAFESDPAVLFVSLHGDPRYLYPGTGFAHEVGVGDGRGFTLNIPLMPGAGDELFLEALRTKALPRIDEFAPQMILISAGFDGHLGDPLGNLRLSTQAFVEATREVVALAERHTGGRIVSVLEGGYNLPNLGDCVVQHVREML